MKFFINYKLIGFFMSFLVFGCVHADGAKRTLSAELNPNCPESICETKNENNATTLIHVRADGENDTLHYIWDLSRQPSVLVALCERDTNVTINWNETFMDVKTVQFTIKPKYTMSFVLTKVFIFNDVTDQASIIGVNKSNIETIDARELTWTREEFNKSTNEVKVAVSGKDDASIGCNGVINLKLKCYNEEDHDKETPHLLHSANVTQVDMEFIDLIPSDTKFESIRIAAEFVLVADSETTKTPFTINKRKTVDDENTPGVFTLIDINTPQVKNNTHASYLQYRPISYTEQSRDITKRTDVHLNQPDFLDDAETYLNLSIAYSYYGNTLDQYLVQSFNVSFGQREDKFYSNYTTWTFILGYGTSPPEHVSMFIAILACIGLGIPLLLLIIGGVYLAVKRMRNC
ncbi:glycosylated lysosomal membrane protein B-like [Contarinia nasturtii]|uniref:glycosylated lysosomal membrane protein B-like n=1 Tax=Contarinia nasturtii TaxID=265458 RepID=UPI0012D3E7DC|nr:glycosylated lysosomal membrane protein B-like [Contarinia nasturtii]